MSPADAGSRGSGASKKKPRALRWAALLLTVGAGGLLVLGGMGAALFLLFAPPSAMVQLPWTVAHQLATSCDAGSGADCRALAQAMMQAGEPRETQRPWLERSCQLELTAGCVDLFDAWGSLGAREISEASLSTTERLCTREGGELCVRLADALLVNGPGMDASRARAAVTRGCRTEDVASCARLAVLAADGVGGDRSLTTVRGALRVVCERGKQAARCAQLADLEGQGEGGPLDYLAAAEHGAIACDAKPEYCWNAAEYGELAAWAACASELIWADEDQLNVSRPVLLQSETSSTYAYTTPDTFETYVEQRGIFFQESYLETRRIPGETYTYEETTIGRYALAIVRVTNNSCQTAHVDSRLSFSFGAVDALSRGVQAGLFVYFIGTLAGVDAEKTKDAAWRAADLGASTGLSANAVVDIPPGESGYLVAEVDTQSMFGENRRMESISIESLAVTFPGGAYCQPACLTELRDLSGALAPVRGRYQRSCAEGSTAGACRYLEAIDAGNELGGLQAACNEGRTPNFLGGCRRIYYQNWLWQPTAVSE